MSGYVYIHPEPGLWTAGFYRPDGAWEPESDHGSPSEAASRVAQLNGLVTAPEASPVVTAAREALAQYRAAAAAEEGTGADWAFITGRLGAALESVLGQGRPEDPHWIVIGAGWRTTLGQLLRDGIDWCRQHTDPDCQACAADAEGQCEAHEEYLGQIGFYRSLARELGIEVRR